MSTPLLPNPLPPTAKSTAERLWPRLTAAQIARVAAHGRTRAVRARQVLIDAGDASAPFLLVVAGELEAVRKTGDGDELIAIYGPGQFTGEISLLAGRRTLVQTRARMPGE